MNNKLFYSCLSITLMGLFVFGFIRYNNQTQPLDSLQLPTPTTAQTPGILPSKKASAHGVYDPHATLKPEQHIQVALQHKAEGRLHEAMRALARAMEQYPDKQDLYGIRASFYMEKNQLSEALQDLEQGLKIAPEDARLLTNRAQVYRQFGQIEQALHDLNTAIQSNPNLLAAHFNRGAIYYSSNEFKKALADFDACIAIDPHTAAPYFNRASTRQAVGHLAGAKEDLNRFIELSENEQWKTAARELLSRWEKADQPDDKASPAS